MDDQVFCDGIGTISVIGGTVRLDLVSYSPTEMDPKGQPVTTFRQRIVMPTDVFLRSAEKMHEVAQAILKRATPAQPQGEPAPAAQVSTAPVSAAPVSTTPASEVRPPNPAPSPSPAPPVKPPFP